MARILGRMSPSIKDHHSFVKSPSLSASEIGTTAVGFEFIPGTPSLILADAEEDFELPPLASSSVLDSGSLTSVIGLL